MFDYNSLSVIICSRQCRGSDTAEREPKRQNMRIAFVQLIFSKSSYEGQHEIGIVNIA